MQISSRKEGGEFLCEFLFFCFVKYILLQFLPHQRHFSVTLFSVTSKICWKEHTSLHKGKILRGKSIAFRLTWWTCKRIATQVHSDCCLKSILGWQEKLFQISKRLASRILGSISTTMKLNVFPVLLSKIKLNYQQNVHLLQIWVIVPIDLCNHFYQISLLYFVTDNRKGCNACSFTRDWQKVANNNNVCCFNDMRFFANGAYVQRKNSQLSGNPLLMLHTFQIIRIRISTCLNVKRVDIWCMLSRSNWKGEEFFWRKWLCYGLCF